jgi:hypothetical protein
MNFPSVIAHKKQITGGNLMTTEEKTYFIYIRSTGEKVPVTKEQHDSFYKEATASATRSRITAGACVRTASSGSATATASAANTTRQVTHFSGSASP